MKQNEPNIIATSKCPMCGDDCQHEHSGIERTIYENGIKAGRLRLAGEIGKPVAWATSYGAVISSTERERLTEQRGHNESPYYIPLFAIPNDFKPWEL